MIWIVVFLVLTIAQGGYIWFQWDKISNIIEVTKFASNILDYQLKDNKKHVKVMGFKEKFILFILRFKKLIWIPIGLMLLINMIVASILSVIIKLILMFF
jgi:hypothetical protein